MARRAERRQRRRDGAPATVQHDVKSARPRPVAPVGFLFPLLIIAAAAYAYSNCLGTAFIFDDHRAIRTNPQIHRLWPPWDALSPPAKTAVAGRPIAQLSLAINYALGGLDVRGYHAVNVGIHILAALAVFGIARRTLAGPRLRNRYHREAPWLALSVAVLWVVHPLGTESVTYLVQRTESLMGLFLLLTLYGVIRGAGAAQPGWWYAAAVVACALGMGSKEVMVAAPLIVLAYDRIFLAASLREMLQKRWGLYAGLASTGLVLAVADRHNLGYALRALSAPRAHAAALDQAVTRWDYAKTQCTVILHYLRLSFWPDPLVADYYDWPVARSVMAVLPAAAVVVLLLGATVVALRWRPELGFLGVWFFCILAPTSSFVPFTREMIAERRMYLPLVAVVTLVVMAGHTALGWACDRFKAPRRTRTVLQVASVALLVIVLGALSRERNLAYRSTTAMWSDVVTKRPDNARARINFADALYRAGDSDGARYHFTEALRIAPGDAGAHYGLGVVLAQQGLRDEAKQQYAQAVQANPRDRFAHNDATIIALAHYNLASMLSSEGNREEATTHLREAVRLKPDYAEAHYNLGVALGGQGMLQDAITEYATALRLKPGLTEAQRRLVESRRQVGDQDAVVGRP